MLTQDFNRDRYGCAPALGWVVFVGSAERERERESRGEVLTVGWGVVG